VSQGFQRVGWFGPRDDRLDPWITSGLEAHALRHAARTCYLIGATAVAARRARRVRLHHEPYGTYNSLCRDEPFWDQPIVIERNGTAFGDYGYSGYLVTEDTVLTCWHGWEQFSQRAQIAVFGYAMHADASEPTEMAARQVLPVAAYPEVLPPPAAQRVSCSGDWVLLRLEHPVSHLGAVAAPQIAAPLPGRAVYTLGYPCGLPLKIAANATILDVADGVFRTDLDTFVGNSGSPVFDAASHALVGMVVAGQQDRGDFEPSPARRCYVASHSDGRVTGQLSVPAECFAPAVRR
jgi:V8-like Glu-specific endopeptidase